MFRDALVVGLFFGIGVGLGQQWVVEVVRLVRRAYCKWLNKRDLPRLVADLALRDLQRDWQGGVGEAEHHRRGVADPEGESCRDF